MALGIGFGVNWGSISLGPGNGGTPIDERFIFTVKTDNAGTSASDQFTIPTSTAGITQAFLYDIETSDGQSITGLTGNHTITFPSAGTYEVRISGSFPRMIGSFAVTDIRKIVSINNFGVYGFGSTSQANAFLGAVNMEILAEDIGHFENVTTFSLFLRDCSKVTRLPNINTSSATDFQRAFEKTALTSFPLLDTSNVTNFFATWQGCTSLTSFPLIDTSSGTNFREAWQNCTSLTSFPLIDTSSGTNFQQAWRSCSSLTSFPLLNTSSGTSLNGAWFFSGLVNYPANAFDTNIATNYGNAFAGTNLTTQSIDDILVSLDTSGVSNGTFNQSGGQAPSATGEAAIDSLVGKGWTITVTGGYAGLGAELITNGTFDTNLSGWIIFDAGVAVWTSDYGGSMKITRGTTLARVGQEIIENTKNYRLTFDVKETNGCSQISVYNGSFYSVVSGIEVGSFQYDFTAGGTFFILAPGPLNIDVTIDNISIKEKL